MIIVMFSVIIIKFGRKAFKPRRIVQHGNAGNNLKKYLKVVLLRVWPAAAAPAAGRIIPAV